MRKTNKIIIHCSATPEGRETTVEDIKRWHTTPPPNGNGWKDIGYHYIIYINGSVHLGRDITKAGAHTKGHNESSIGICYVGGIDKDMKPKNTLNINQQNSLIQLIKDLLVDYPNATIHGHNEFAPKACPSFFVKEKILPLL